MRGIVLLPLTGAALNSTATNVMIAPTLWPTQPPTAVPTRTLSPTHTAPESLSPTPWAFRWSSTDTVEGCDCRDFISTKCSGECHHCGYSADEKQLPSDMSPRATPIRSQRPQLVTRSQSGDFGNFIPCSNCWT